MASSTLSQHLLQCQSASFEAATSAPFLKAAGLGRISKITLAQYLSQDRLYQQAYVRFLGQLLGKLRFDVPASRASLMQRTLDVLVAALVNIRDELKSFESIAEKWGFGLETPLSAPDDRLAYRELNRTGFGPTPITRGYIDFFVSVSGPSSTLLEGLVALWGTEKCYLEAWKVAKDLTPPGSVDFSGDSDEGALRGDLMPTWTTPEFEEFVEKIETLMNEVAQGRGEELTNHVRGCEDVWRQVLWLEERFWPHVDESS
ncbi:hypothetical protein MMC25_004948 [Agyrium rufum]|nr:hypothetical protein [Agyrium rufum]